MRRVPFSYFAGPDSFRRYGGRRVPFSCFARPDSFSAVPRASGPFFMFCAPKHVFDGAERVGSRFHVFRARTCFLRCRGCRVPFSCFVLPDSLSTVPRASGPVSMFCAPGLIVDGTETVGSRFHVLRSRTRFRQYRVRRVLFSCFARLDTFSTVPRASCLVFMFCAPGLVFGGTEGVESRFHVLHSRTRFRRYRGCRVPFTCFALPESFSTVSWASGPDFMFCAPRIVSSVTEGVGSRFNVVCSQSLFRRCRMRQVPFSYFVLLDSFSSVPNASGPVFIFCPPEIIFGGTEGVGSRFHGLCSQTRFRRCRMRQVPFSYLARSDSFSAVPRASGPVFMFCAPGLIFGSIESVGSRFHVLRSRTHFRGY
jgi:hypothetical protein